MARRCPKTASSLISIIVGRRSQTRVPSTASAHGCWFLWSRLAHAHGTSGRNVLRGGTTVPEKGGRRRALGGALTGRRDREVGAKGRRRGDRRPGKCPTRCPIESIPGE